MRGQRYVTIEDLREIAFGLLNIVLVPVCCVLFPLGLFVLCAPWTSDRLAGKLGMHFEWPNGDKGPSWLDRLLLRMPRSDWEAARAAANKGTDPRWGKNWSLRSGNDGPPLMGAAFHERAQRWSREHGTHSGEQSSTTGE
jgi:hypothetical protein